jgi:ketosteroid isomerase-like protein
MRKMKKLLLLLLLPSLLFSQEKEWNEEQKEIRSVIEQQRQDWNAYDLEGFMQGYWKSDQLKFYGSNGVTSGWQSTLERYEKAYPSKDHTGKLNFVVKEINKIQQGAYYVMGEYHLERTVGDAHGIFMIIFKKIDGQWKIISDTSC